MKKILTAIVVALLATLALGFAAPSQALSFTTEETAFINDQATIGIVVYDRQQIVDLGWAIVYDMTHGTPVGTEVGVLYALSPRAFSPPLSYTQAAAEVSLAMVDLNDGSSPSPGGAWSGPLTGLQGEYGDGSTLA